MIIKKEKIGGIWKYVIKKNISDEDMLLFKNTYVKPSQIDFIIDDLDNVNEQSQQVFRNYIVIKFRYFRF